MTTVASSLAERSQPINPRRLAILAGLVAKRRPFEELGFLTWPQPARALSLFHQSVQRGGLV